MKNRVKNRLNEGEDFQVPTTKVQKAHAALFCGARGASAAIERWAESMTHAELDELAAQAKAQAEKDREALREFSAGDLESMAKEGKVILMPDPKLQLARTTKTCVTVRSTAKRGAQRIMLNRGESDVLSPDGSFYAAHSFHLYGVSVIPSPRTTDQVFAQLYDGRFRFRFASSEMVGLPLSTCMPAKANDKVPGEPPVRDLTVAGHPLEIVALEAWQALADTREPLADDTEITLALWGVLVEPVYLARGEVPFTDKQLASWGLPIPDRD